MNDVAWDTTVLPRNRKRLMQGEVTARLLRAQARAESLLSDVHSTVDGTLIRAWANRSSVHPKQDPPARAAEPEASYCYATRISRQLMRKRL